MPTNNDAIIPPGAHPCDPAKTNIDPVGYALKKLQTYMVWLDEHASAYEKYRSSDPSTAQTELGNLKDAYEHAVLHLQRLTELILAGHGIDPNKALPRDMCSEVWKRIVEICMQRRSALYGG
jgi:hypothetical protein